MFEIDYEAISRLSRHSSHPYPVKPRQEIALRVLNQFGEETTKVGGRLLDACRAVAARRRPVGCPVP
jgi:hypothetical protein